jgi:uridine kinase
MDLKIYIETGERECFRRRLKRDTVERGRTPGSVARQYEATVRPMAEQYVWPTRQYAGLIISGEQSYTEAVTIVLARLETVNLPRFLEE